MPAIFFPSLPFASETVTDTSLFLPTGADTVSRPEPHPFGDVIERVTPSVGAQTTGTVSSPEQAAP